MSRMGKALDIAYALGAVVSSPVWGYSLLRTGKWRTDWRGRFGVGVGEVMERRGGSAKPQAAGRGGKTLLIHAVSVGEVSLVRNLVGYFEENEPGVRVVICTTTNTGFTRATALYGERHWVVRFPFDFSGAVGRFLDAVRPDAVALTELEVWPNFMQACGKRGIPVAVINGRLSERSFKGYRRFRRLLCGMFASLSAVGAQTEAYAGRFIEMGVRAERVRVLDTMKWDAAKIVDHVDGAGELAKEMGIDRGRPLIVAGSTGVGEEKMLIESCPGDVQLMLVPRKPERFEAVAGLSSQMVRRTKPGEAASGGRLFLLDTMGELAKAYALADVVIVGRSFNGWGGSDPIEPVALGKATVIGPDYHNFADAVSALEAGTGGGLIVTDRPGEVVAGLLGDPGRRVELAKRGREVILSRQGATRRHADMLMGLLGLQR
jgi:3-deoxy-D-manno-octulosonic-acid transferase